MENNSVRYSYSPLCHVKLPLTMEYDRLVSLLCKTMSVSKRSVNIKVTGRYPYSVTLQGVACYAMFNIEGDETLTDILRTSDEHRELLVIKMLKMYVKAEDVRNNEVSKNRDILQSSVGVLEQFYTNRLRVREFGQI